MSLATVHSCALAGVTALPVVVEVHLGGGLPGTAIVGLPQSAVKESKDRVKAAIRHAGFRFPQVKVIVNLAPADLPKRGGRFDLPIALGILIASEQLPAGVADGLVVVGELGLGGELRGVEGVLSMAQTCRESGEALLLPAANLAEATRCRGVRTRAVGTLAEACEALAETGGMRVVETGDERAMVENGATRGTGTDGETSAESDAVPPGGDLADVIGQHAARRALEIAAAGGHNVLFSGPPGTGKSMLASRLPGILPPMDEREAAETAAIRSVSHAGFDPATWGVRPFRSPHHTASGVALVGGGCGFADLMRLARILCEPVLDPRRDTVRVMFLAVPFQYGFEPIRRSIAIDTGLPATGEDGAPLEWVVWACHGFLKNTLAPSQTNARVAFRRLGDGEVHEEILRTLPAAALSLMPIGSVWQENRSERQTVLATEDFTVDYGGDRSKFRSFAAAGAADGATTPYPRKYPALNESADRIQYLDLDLRSGGRLVIPCAEFFIRTYGASHYLRQVLLGYPWEPEGDPSNRLYGALRVAAEPDAWTVRLRPRLDDRDAVFLAHAKYDSFTTREAKGPYAQLESAFDSNHPDAPISVKVGPWHKGEESLEVQGLPFDEGRSFLALRITGCSVPKGPAIHVDRDNSNLAERAAAPGDRGKAWRSSKPKATESSELTGKEEPDHGSAIVDVTAPSMKLIGPERPLTKVVAEQATGSASKLRLDSDAGADDTLSSGEAHGADKGVSHASVRTPRLQLSDDVVSTMWKAALSLHQRHPATISQVQWYTPADGYRSDSEPGLVVVPEFQPDIGGGNAIPGAVRSWPYLSVPERQRRGVLVMRLLVEAQSVHLIEIQRRASVPKGDETDDKKGASKGEAFCGLAARLENDSDLPEWLSDLLDVLRYRKGVVHSTLEIVGVPGEAVWYQHRFGADGETVPGERALINALRRVGFPRLLR